MLLDLNKNLHGFQCQSSDVATSLGFFKDLCKDKIPGSVRSERRAIYIPPESRLAPCNDQKDFQKLELNHQKVCYL